MEKIYIGKIVNTHGIKGELRILSKFPYKDRVFKPNHKLIIDDKEYTIRTYRPHKEYDMVTLDDYKNINEVLFLLKKEVYYNKEELNLEDDEVLDEDLIHYHVVTTTKEEGTITEIFYASEANKILRVQLNHEVLIPFSSPMIKKIDKEKKEIVIELIEGY
ncbi:MAG: 16S rRNA processing protein RimM [Bacilli bacterium]|nr:16S rRNA processing protein RimM [Bacilli bacterium]